MCSPTTAARPTLPGPSRTSRCLTLTTWASSAIGEFVARPPLTRTEKCNQNQKVAIYLPKFPSFARLFLISKDCGRSAHGWRAWCARELRRSSRVLVVRRGVRETYCGHQCKQLYKLRGSFLNRFLIFICVFTFKGEPKTGWDEVFQQNRSS